MNRKYLIAACLFFTPAISHATTIDGSTLNTLSVLSSAGIGSTLVSAAEIGSLATGVGAAVAIGAGVAYYAQTGENPVYAAASSVASAADAVFVPAYQAFKATFVSPESYPASAAQYVGREASVGGTVANLADMAKSHTDTYPLLSAMVTANTTSGTLPDTLYSSITAGSIFDTNKDLNVILTPTGAYSTMAYSYYPTAYANATYKFPLTNGGCFSRNSEGYGTNSWMCWPGGTSGVIRFYYYNATLTDQSATVAPADPTVDYDGLKNAITAANSNASFADEVRNAVKNLDALNKIASSSANPTTLPAASAVPITNNDISNFFTANTTNVYNEYLNSVANGGDATTGQAAAELAKAQAEEAQKDTEEKFSSISSNPFSQSYNPGPFDIPTRFTTFLGNVKSSGLFSFSSAFFDSLPGGGSPVYTVNAGHYGTHTVDLSDTMSTGLAVLKSILLACFGFLSIRAVIMKR